MVADMWVSCYQVLTSFPNLPAESLDPQVQILVGRSEAVRARAYAQRRRAPAPGARDRVPGVLDHGRRWAMSARVERRLLAGGGAANHAALLLCILASRHAEGVSHAKRYS
jgi:hypothetical protein